MLPVEHGPSTRRSSELLSAEAGRAATSGSDVQYVHLAGAIDLTWGHPDPSALAADAVLSAADSVLNRRGWQSLTYGAPAGAATLREAIASRCTLTDCATRADEIVVTSGSSGALDLLLSLRARPGDVVYVEQPTYFLALRIFADHGVEVVALAGDEHGPDPTELERRAGDRGARSAFLYLVSTFANPTGRSLPTERGEQLLAAARRTATLVIDDDVYRDTAPAAPGSLRSLDPGVVRIGSFSKSVAPGLRVGYLCCPPQMADEIAACGLLDSGGGANHFAAMVVGELIDSGVFAAIVDDGFRRYSERRRVLADALDADLFGFSRPAGGFFLWLALPEGVTSSEAVEAALQHGVSVSDGRSFFAGRPTGDFVRLSFSMLEPELLVGGGARLNAAVRSIC